MTNETTASQPKSTPQEKIPQESIGDDAANEILKAMSDYVTNWSDSLDHEPSEAEISGQAINFIARQLDSCAQAYQASATIQEPVMVAEPDWKPGTWFEARTLDEMEAFYMSRLPMIRAAAKEHGYAIGLHGTARRDFDLMAMQWRVDASDKDSLARAVADAACGIRREGAYDWEVKPSGRVAVSIPVCWTDHSNPDFDKPSIGHIDLSVIEFAAPMVADPAGVALEMTDAQIDDAICLVYATDYQEDSAAYDRAIVRAALASLAATIQEPVMVAEPVEMILHCPTCHVQHVDAPDERTVDWANPPHRSHLCHACGCIWRPADVPTSGVAAIKTSGKADTAMPAVELNGGMHASIFAKVWGDAGGGDAGRIALANYAFNLGSHSAAPMVADPAGAESVRASFESWCIRNNFSTNKWPDGVYLVSETVGAWEGWQAALAATVKAVPSEAVDAGPFTLEQRMPPKGEEVLIYFAGSNGKMECRIDEWDDLHEDPIGMGGPTICVGEGWVSYYEDNVTHWAPIPAVNFAAPLADKTGGGE